MAQFGTEEDADNEFFVFDMEVFKQLAGSFTQPPLFSDTFMSPAAGARWNMLSLGGARTRALVPCRPTRFEQRVHTDGAAVLQGTARGWGSIRTRTPGSGSSRA